MGEAFTRNFKALREDSGLLQYQLADAVGLRQGTVSAWEQRLTQPRSPKVIKLLCDYFHCTEADLFGYSDGYYAKTRGISAQFKSSTTDTQTITLNNKSSVRIPKYIIDSHPIGIALRISDTAMEHEMPIGAIAYIDTQETPATGSIVAIRIDKEHTFRHLTVYDEVYVLDVKTCDAQYKKQLIDRAAPPTDFEILGRVVWMQKEL